MMIYYSKTQKKLIGALIGLARALDETNSDRTVFSVIKESLIMLDKADEKALSEQTEKVHLEKNRAVPDCSVCPNPCGKTFDYDLDDLVKLDKRIVELKFELLKKLSQFAEDLSLTDSDFKQSLEIMAGALFLIGYDFADRQELERRIISL